MERVEDTRLHAVATSSDDGPQGKNIIICSDGTGNSAITGRGSNVFKLFEAVDSHGHRRNPKLVPQVTYYDDGVGTETLKYVRALAGATGFGLSRNVKQLYLQLVRVYEPGDRIYLFGFSRGAFTVRTLAGMIAACGVLDARHETFTSDGELWRGVERAYSEYRRRCRTKLAELLSSDTGMPFCDRHRVRHPVHAPNGAVPIRFVGVWDTVDAVGLPLSIADIWNETIWRFKFKDRKLSHLVQQGCHALALDDERESFEPVLWDERGELADRLDPSGTLVPRIEQVWFAGAHSNVGGGYPRHGMSLVALHWMMSRAQAAGVRFVPGELTYYEQRRNVDDKLYDPRAGVGVFYRWKPRNVARLCKKSGVEVKVHASVFERIARSTEGYAPGNVPPTAAVTTTGPATIDLSAIRSLLGSGDTVHARLRRTLRVGRASYHLFMLTVLGAVGSVVGHTYADGGGPAMADLVTQGTGLVWQVPSMIYASTPTFAFLVVGLLLAYVLSAVTDKRVERACSEFWHDKQTDLLQPLLLQRGPASAVRRSPPPN